MFGGVMDSYTNGDLLTMLGISAKSLCWGDKYTR